MSILEEEHVVFNSKIISIIIIVIIDITLIIHNTKPQLSLLYLFVIKVVWTSIAGNEANFVLWRLVQYAL